MLFVTGCLINDKEKRNPQLSHHIAIWKEKNLSSPWPGLRRGCWGRGPGPAACTQRGGSSVGRLLRDKQMNVYNCEDAEDRRRMTLLPSLPERTHVCTSPTLKPLCGLLGTALGASQKAGLVLSIRPAVGTPLLLRSLWSNLFFFFYLPILPTQCV